MFAGRTSSTPMGNEEQNTLADRETKIESSSATNALDEQLRVRECTVLSDKENLLPSNDIIVKKLQLQVKQQQTFIEEFMQEHKKQMKNFQATIAHLENRLCSCEAREKIMQIDLAKMQNQNTESIHCQPKQLHQSAEFTPHLNPFRRGSRQAFPDFDEMFKEPVAGRTPPPKSRDENTDVQTPAAFDLTVQLMSEFGPQDDILHDGRGRILTMTQEAKDRAVSHTAGDSDKIFRFVHFQKLPRN